MKTALKLRISPKDLTDTQIYKLSDIGCYPAFCEFSIRTFKKKSLDAKFDRLNSKFFLQKGHMPEYKGLYSTGLPKFKIKSALLTQFHKKLYDIPLRFFVSPLNTNDLNKKLLDQKLDLKIKDVVFFINNRNLSLGVEGSSDQLSVKSIRDLISSIIWVNWHLNSIAYRRPPSKILQYYFTAEEVKEAKLLSHKKFLKRITLGAEGKLILESKISLHFIRLASIEISFLINRMSATQIANLIRLAYISNNLNAVDDEVLKFLPIFSLLNKRSYSLFPTFNKIYKAGYTRVIHSEIFSEEFIQLTQNKKLQSSLQLRLVRGSDR